MTIAIGFRYDRGVLICSDSQYTVGTMKVTGKKVFRAEIGEERIIFGIAGSVPYARMVIEKSVQEVSRLTVRSKLAVRAAIEKVLLNIYKKHVYSHPEFRREGGPDFWLIAGIWSHLDGLDFFNTSDTATSDITDYLPLGIGQDVAQLVLKSIFRHRRLSLDDTASVAVHVLRETKENVSFCGGPNQYAYLDAEGQMGGGLRLELSGKEGVSQAVAEAVRRLYLFASDPETTDEKMEEELETVRLIINGSRDHARRDRAITSGSLEILRASASIVEPPDFKLP